MSKTPLYLAAERGSSMLAVIGLMAVAGVATLAIAGSTMNSIGVSSATRAGVQAQAAAEAGIDAGVLQLNTGCPLVVNGELPTTDPKAHVTFSHLDSGSTVWAEGCPSATGQAKMISTGTAADLGVGGNNTGDERKVEAVYAYTGPTAEIDAIASTPLDVNCLTAKITGMANDKFGFQLKIRIAASETVSCVVQRLKNLDLFDAPGDLTSFLELGPEPTEVELAQCNLADIQLTVNAFSAGGVIDARSCTEGLSLTGGTNDLVLKGDVEIWAPGFSVAEGFTVKGAAGSELFLTTDYEDASKNLHNLMKGNGWKNQVTITLILNTGAPGPVTPGVAATDGSLGARISIRDLNG